MKQKALECGRCSGRDTDKAAKLGIGLVDAKAIAPKVVEASKVVFECRLSDTVAVGDHTFFIADVVEIYGDESKKQLFAINGYGKLDTVEM